MPVQDAGTDSFSLVESSVMFPEAVLIFTRTALSPDVPVQTCSFFVPPSSFKLPPTEPEVLPASTSSPVSAGTLIRTLPEEVITVMWSPGFSKESVTSPEAVSASTRPDKLFPVKTAEAPDNRIPSAVIISIRISPDWLLMLQFPAVTEPSFV